MIFYGSGVAAVVRSTRLLAGNIQGESTVTARVRLFSVLMLLSAHAHSQCEVKIYRDMLVVSSGPSCLSSALGKEKIASGVKDLVNDLNEVSRPGSGGERNLSTRDKLYRLAEFQQHDRVINQSRMQSELRRNNRFAHQQRGLD